MIEYPLYIGGEWVNHGAEESFVSYHKATGEAVARFSTARTEDVDAACRAARRAFPAWAALSGDERAEHLLEVARIMRSRWREMAEYEAVEGGKPICDAYNFDIWASIWAFEYFANLAREVKGDVIPMGGVHKDDLDFATYEPYGVAAVIAPYNYPLHLLTRSLAPALAAGNTCVIKAASYTPSTTAILGQIFEAAGVPAGVLNVLQGPGATVGHGMVAHPEVDVVGFTGSEEVGRELMRISADAEIIKKLILELGGKGGVIVEPDADLDIAVACEVDGYCGNQGEVCCAMTRLILHEDIAEEYLNRLREKSAAVKMGPLLDEETRMGCLISESHLQSVDAHVQNAVAQGAKLFYGGKRYSEGACAGGPYYMPTILTGATPDMDIWHQEVFGPVVVVTTYRDTEEAIRLANQSRFGLGANIFTRDLAKAYHIGRQLNAGSVWVNLFNGMHIAAPFGGNKNSGMGREYGTYGLHEYLKVKNNMWRMRP